MRKTCRPTRNDESQDEREALGLGTRRTDRSDVGCDHRYTFPRGERNYLRLILCSVCLRRRAQYFLIPSRSFSETPPLTLIWVR